MWIKRILNSKSSRSSCSEPTIEYSSLGGCGVVDCHAHILPSMDDGSDSVQTTENMLQALRRQQLAGVIATPHFYGTEEFPDRFFARRARAAEKTWLLTEHDLPIYLGAEVAYFPGIGYVKEMRDFCICGTAYMLLEMPFERWNAEIFEDVERLQEQGIRPILAHIERYLDNFEKDDLRRLIADGVMIQSNASFFINRSTATKALRMLENGSIHLLGSDVHNLTTRPVRIGEALSAIQTESGDAAVKKIAANCRMILQGATPLAP